MRDYVSILRTCVLFQDHTEDEISGILESLHTAPRRFTQGECIAHQGEEARYMGIILYGMVQIQKLYPNGEEVTIGQLAKAQTFGEAVLFSHEQVYPGSIVSVASATVLLIPKDKLLALFLRDPRILHSFISNLSNRIVFLTERIEVLSKGSLRQKVVYFLRKEYQKQGSLSILLPVSKQRLSEYLAIPRPSLSRELLKMQAEGLLAVQGRRITLLSALLLEEDKGT